MLQRPQCQRFRDTKSVIKALKCSTWPSGFPVGWLSYERSPWSVRYRAGVYYHRCCTWQRHQAMFPGWASVSEPRWQHRPLEVVSEAYQQKVQTDCLSRMLKTDWCKRNFNSFIRNACCIFRMDANGSETKKPNSSFPAAPRLLWLARSRVNGQWV